MTSPSSPKRSCGSETRNWTGLPADITAAILSRIGAIEILVTAQRVCTTWRRVCTTWRRVCQDPLMWRVIDLRSSDFDKVLDLGKLCRHAVDRSSGHLTSINIEYFGTDQLLYYIADSSSQIRQLRLVDCNITSEGLNAVSLKLPLLEDLEISLCSLLHDSLEVVGASCPLLKSLKLNNREFSPTDLPCDKDALAIARTMHGLKHLQLFANLLTDDGLQAILDGCPHLESVDLRQCYNLFQRGDLEKKLGERIKVLQLPDESDDSSDDHEFPIFYEPSDSEDEFSDELLNDDVEDD